VDAVVDIVGAALCLEALQVDRVLCGTVELGGGFARCAHGLLPVPAPATALLLTGVPVQRGTVPFEATTPTGAALLATFVDEYTRAASFTIDRTGYGIGQRDADVPNVLRVFLGETTDVEPVEMLWLLECNLDDMNPELYAHVMERLLTAGANDVYLTPILMKKSRPATLLSVLCEPAQAETLTAILFTETTTLGVRRHPVSRVVLAREFTTVTTRYGDITLKTAYFRGQPVNRKPEYADCSRLAAQQQIPIKRVYDEVYRVLSALSTGDVTKDQGNP
jgi:hypothetical protein